MVRNIAFLNREEAGQELASILAKYSSEKPVVLGMPRGGVVLAAIIADKLHAPLDVIVARKIGAPSQPEYAIGAIAPGDVSIFNPEARIYFDFDSNEVREVIEREKIEMERRIKLYRGNKAELDLKDRVVIIVDDGLATGQTALAAVRSIRKLNPRKIILAVGVSSIEAAQMLGQEVDALVALRTPAEFHAVGLWYKEFPQTTDAEVTKLLKQNVNE